MAVILLQALIAMSERLHCVGDMMINREYICSQIANILIKSDSIISALDDTIRVLTATDDWPLGHVLTAVYENSGATIAQSVKLSAYGDTIVKMTDLHISLAMSDSSFLSKIIANQKAAYCAIASEGYKDPRLVFFKTKKIQSTVAVPVMFNGRVKYIIELFSTDLQEFDGLFLEELNQISNNLEIVMNREKSSQEFLQLSRAIESSPLSVAICNTEGTIEFVNTEFCRSTGYAQSEVIGETPRITNSGLHPKSFFKSMWTDISAGKNWSGEVCNQKKDGTRFWERVTISPIRNQQNIISHYIAFKEDVTEQRAMENELRRTRAAAIEANQAKSDFVANMSHEIRTPMNAIIGLSHLLLKSRMATKHRRKVKQIASSAEGLLDVINAILDFSKIEAGKMELETIDFDLSMVLDEIGVIIGQRARQKGIEFVIDLSPETPIGLVGDPVRLRQVLLNLCGNAVKFTEQGEVVLRVELLQKSAGNVSLLISVTDTGIGIPDDKMNTLFSPFTQVDSSTTRRFGGTGLGLSISNHLIGMMGGRLLVQSTPGKGSSFQIELRFPLAQNQYIPPGIPSLSELKMTIVEDNAEVRNSIRRLMGIYVNTIETFPTGAEFLTYIQNNIESNNLPNLILLDFHLPDIDAAEIAKRLHKMGVNHIPMVVFTGRDDEAIREKCSASGVLDIYTKPITRSVAVDILMNCWVQDPQRVSTPVRSIYPHLVAQSHKILLVEDNPINMEVASEILEAEGYTVEAATDGKEAVEKIFGNPPNYFDVVLMDLQMPVLNGMDACKKIRAMEEFDHLPLLALTADIMEDVKKKANDAGFNDFISKPIRPGVFFKTICKWLPDTTAFEDAPDTSVPAISSEEAMEGEVSGEGLVAIDTAKGLAHLNGNHTLYIKLLKSFLSAHAGDAKKIGEYIRANKPDSARLTAHTLKGLAATLGFSSAGSCAANLQAALLSSDIKEQMRFTEMLQLETNRVVHDIKLILKSNQANKFGLKEKPATVTADVFEQLHQFIVLLEEENLDAATRLDEMRGQMNSLLKIDTVNQLEDQIMRLEFKAAALSLRHLLEENAGGDDDVQNER